MSESRFLLVVGNDNNVSVTRLNGPTTVLFPRSSDVVDAKYSDGDDIRQGTPPRFTIVRPQDNRVVSVTIPPKNGWKGQGTPVSLDRVLYGRSRPIAQPFGHRNYDGLNFARSVKDKTSRLSRVVRYIRKYGQTSRVELLTNALGFVPSHTIRHVWKGGRNGGRVTIPSNGLEGHSSPFFSLAVKTGFLRSKRIGNSVVYTLGRRARLVK